MSSPRSPSRRMARLIARHAARSMPPQRVDWALAIQHEFEHLPHDAPALRWAFGCLLASYTLRMLPMHRKLSASSRWVLTLEMLVCLVPLTWLFGAVVIAVVRGMVPSAAGVLFASAALAGPVGLLAAVRTITLNQGTLGRITMVVLGVLAAWTFAAMTWQCLRNHTPIADWWRDFVLIALLPCLAIAHLSWIAFSREMPAPRSPAAT
ncbi:MAG TPA: hypothetical protein VLW26_04475 [Steroidobacteraceae bacterium]|nr:hypothetical protein [Steroidobacteraceae bacterium]